MRGLTMRSLTLRPRTWTGLLLVGTAACTVHEEHRRPPPPPPAPAVIYEPAPPPPVEVIPVAPGPEFVWVPGGYYRDRDRWLWRHGEYRRRY
jgi:hypothetical protein